MKLTLLLPIFLCLSTFVFGQTKLPSTIAANTTLTKANSPYSIESNMTVNAGVTLKIEAGVVVKLGSGINISLKGNLIAQGTKEDSIFFTALVKGKPWGMINSTNSNIELYYFVNTGSNRFISATGSDILISNSRIISTSINVREDKCILAYSAKRVTVTSSYLVGAGGTIETGTKDDAISVKSCDSLFVTNCYITRFSDDAIDAGIQTKYAYIEGNILTHSNFGVTIGEQCTAYIYRNITADNDGGFQVHSRATVYGSNNIIYSNTDGIECYHSEEGNSVQTGGKVHLTNTVFYQNHRSDITKQTSSVVDLTYCLSDKETLPGLHNLTDDPKFVDSANLNFHILTGSPCINNGAPDKNGSPTTIGLFDFATSVVKLSDQAASFSVFPNPAGNQIQIQYPAINGKTQVIITDLSGRTIHSSLIVKNQTSVDISIVPSGIYFLTLLTDKTNLGTVKLIKQ